MCGAYAQAGRREIDHTCDMFCLFFSYRFWCFSGPIPEALGDLTKLEMLNLYFNMQLEGEPLFFFVLHLLSPLD